MQATSSSSGSVAPGGAHFQPDAPRFVVNLCASTTPVALVQPTHTGLKRFTFFVSRRLEEGRERFRLHMGYFDSQEEAEKILELVRDVYPAAWAGVAPGIKLRAHAAVAESVAARSPIAAAVPVPAAVPDLPPEAPAATLLKLELVPDSPRMIPTVEKQPGPAARSLSAIRATINSLDDAPPPSVPASASRELTDSTVLRLLEAPPAVPLVQQASTVVPTLRATPAAPANETPLFAVQLLWSVQPVDMNQVPQLAIFSAYTLYGAEGNQDGRRWYGLRLGFFTDAVSAKQVAHYVRSEFASVSVVPVTIRERERAGVATAKPLPALASAKRNGVELNFIEEPADTATSRALALTARATPGKRVKVRVGGAKQVSKRPAQGPPTSLEETLEVLGAGDLQMDKGRGERLNDDSLVDRKTPPPGGSRFGRLINRLADRLANS